MKFYFTPRRSQLKVFSAICSNFVVVWIVAAFVAKDIFALTIDIVFAILSWYLAIKAEEVLEEYDKS